MELGPVLHFQPGAGIGGVLPHISDASNLGFRNLGHRPSATRDAAPHNLIEFRTWVCVRSWLEMHFSDHCRKQLNIGYLGGTISSRLRVGFSNQLRVHEGRSFQPTAGKSMAIRGFVRDGRPIGPFPANCGKAPGKVDLLI